MTAKMTSRSLPGVRERAVRMMLENAGDYPTRWAAVELIAAKIGCAAQTLHECNAIRCVIRRKPAGDSDRSQPPIPRHPSRP